MVALSLYSDVTTVKVRLWICETSATAGDRTERSSGLTTYDKLFLLNKLPCVKLPASESPLML